MERWDEGVREDHQALEAQVGALEVALTIDARPEDKRVSLFQIIRALGPALELHLRKEEGVLFPALQKLLREETSALTLLKDQHRELRASIRRLTEQLQGSGSLNWEEISALGRLFTDLLEDHEKKEDRLLIDVLEFSLKPEELKELARSFQRAVWKLHEEMS